MRQSDVAYLYSFNLKQNCAWLTSSMVTRCVGLGLFYYTNGWLIGWIIFQLFVEVESEICLRKLNIWSWKKSQIQIETTFSLIKLGRYLIGNIQTGKLSSLGNKRGVIFIWKLSNWDYLLFKVFKLGDFQLEVSKLGYFSCWKHQDWNWKHQN